MIFVYRNLGKRFFLPRTWGLGWGRSLCKGKSLGWEISSISKPLWRRASVVGRKDLCPVFVRNSIMILRICLGKVSVDSFSCHSGGLQVRRDSGLIFCQAGSWGNLKGILGGFRSISVQCGGGFLIGEEILGDCEAEGRRRGLI